jgi:hypothetical protein
MSNHLFDCFIKHSLEVVDKEISKLKSINYNKFYWWRLYSTKNSALPKNSSLLARIKNGDMDYSHYYWMAQKALYNAYSKVDISKHTLTDQIEILSIDLERYRHLMDDFLKDEKNKLDEIYKCFLKEFHITREDFEKCIFNFEGDLEELYNHIKNFYTKKSSKKSLC